MTPAWTPSLQRISRAQVTAFMGWLQRNRGLDFPDYPSLWQWSVDDLSAFWNALWDWQGIPYTGVREPVLASRAMPGAQWYPQVKLNFTQQVFRHDLVEQPAIIAQNEAGLVRSISWKELRRQVASLAASLQAHGIGPGDRVVAYMPNIPEAMIAALAVFSLGAVWSICSPDMGKIGVLDRFRQIAPKAIIAVDGYRYGGKAHDRRALLQELLVEMPSIAHLWLLPQLSDTSSDFPKAISWRQATSGEAAFSPTLVPFNHPLWVLYSSGTTGLPKAIVHSQGGALLELVKLLSIHCDVHLGDRFFWYSSTGWMMWNVQLACLLLGATACIFDGNPGYPDQGALWRFASDQRLTFFGAGAAYYAACQKAEIAPAKMADLTLLSNLGSTGSPLSPENYQWLLAQVKADLWISPISGGTDIVSAFVAGVPILPVHLGEMQCRCLGASIEAFNESGTPVTDEVGELVCTKPMPSMPLYFWDDKDHARYHDSYFDTYPGIWRHGDWMKLTPRGGVIIYGRSDATINRHGIRMGTSELYRAVEDIPQIIDSMVVDLEYLGRGSYMPLFVVMREGEALTPELVGQIKQRIKVALSARHVPDDIFAVPAIPRTLTGKKLELPIKKLLLGQPLEKAMNTGALGNPDCLPWYLEFARHYLNEKPPT